MWSSPGEPVWSFQCRFGHREPYHYHLTQQGCSSFCNVSGWPHPSSDFYRLSLPPVSMFPCHLTPWDRALGCQSISALPFVTRLGWHQCQRALGDSHWADPRACDQYRAVLEQHCTFWQRGKPPWSFWSPGRSVGALQSLAGLGTARTHRLAHICGAAAGQDEGTAQQGPADRGLVWPGWRGATGEPWWAGILPRNYMALEWKFSGVVQPQEELLLSLHAQSRQSHRHSTLAQEVEGWEGPVALPAALWLPLQPRAQSPGQLCLVSFPSSIPPASVAKQQLRDGSIASALFQKALVRMTVA